MRLVLGRIANSGILIGTAAMSLAVVTVGRASALDASFIPQASATLSCVSADKSDKKITSFENNAPAGSQVVLVEGKSEGGGTTFGKEVLLGDVVTNTPQLFWSIQGVQLGPWEVPTTIEGTCLTNESVYAEPTSKASVTAYAIGAGAVLVLLGAYVLGKKLGRR